MDIEEIKRNLFVYQDGSLSMQAYAAIKFLEAENAKLIVEVATLRKAFKLASNSAAGLSQYCDNNASVRRCEKELEQAEAIYRTIPEYKECKNLNKST